MDKKKLISAILISVCFGSIHSYGVLLSPIEEWLHITRTQTSTVYSVAILAITLGVFVTGRLEVRYGIGITLLGCGALAVAGLALSCLPSYYGLIVGFGLLFGLANGIAYSLCLVLAAQSMPARKGNAIGVAVAAYGLGAVIFAQIFDLSLKSAQVSELLLALGVLCFAVCCISGMLAGFADTRQTAHGNYADPLAGAQLLGLWAFYCVAAFAGLMILVHGPSIAAQNGVISSGLAAGIVSLGSVTGSYLGGVFADRVSGRVSLGVPMLLQSIALILLGTVTSFSGFVSGLGLAGIAYGAVTSAVPVEVLRISGPQYFSRDYGKIVTAWGFAGLVGPIAAGYFYDLYGGYTIALAIAGGSSAIAIILSFSMHTLKSRQSTRTTANEVKILVKQEF